MPSLLGCAETVLKFLLMGRLVSLLLGTGGLPEFGDVDHPPCSMDAAKLIPCRQWRI